MGAAFSLLVGLSLKSNCAAGILFEIDVPEGGAK
jgi:hypothetical protein